MGNSPFEDDFNEKGVRGSLEEILDILHENEVEENTLLSVTLPAVLWFDVMQSCAVAGGMLLSVAEEEIDEDTKNSCLVGVDKTQTAYNEVWDALVRLAKQKIK